MNKLNATLQFSWIQSLRGSAALLVAFIHFWGTCVNYHYVNLENAWVKLIQFFTYELFNFGKIGIVIFFLVSGWLVPTMLQRKSKMQFLKNRFFRLYPAFWLSILVSVFYSYKPSLFLIVMNATMLHKFFGVDDLIDVYWTLQIEIAFYIFCVFLQQKKWLFQKAKLTALLYALLGLAFSLALLRYFTNYKLPVAMPLGLAVMFLAHLWRMTLEENSEQSKLEMRKIIAAFVLVFIPLCYLAYNHDYGHHEAWYRYLSSYAAAFLLFEIFRKKNMKNSVLQYLGTISYSLYLLHSVTGNAFLRKANLSGLQPQLGNTTCLLIAALFIIVASSISYYFVEKPAINYSKGK